MLADMNTRGETKDIMREIQNVKTDIKNLAKIFGLKYECDEAPFEILFAIEEELEAQIDEAEENPQELSTLMAYMHKLNSLDAILNEIYEVEAMFKPTQLIKGKNLKLA